MADIVKLKTQQAIHEDLMNVVFGETRISDANLGSVIRTLTYAVANRIYEQHYRLYRSTKGMNWSTAKKKQLSDIVTNWGLERKAAVKAIGPVYFEASGGGDATIEPGTILKAPATASRGVIEFQTTNTSNVVIPAGTGTTLHAQATNSGPQANLKKGAITYLETSITNLDSWEQKGPTKLGTYRETDSQLIQRLLSMLDDLTRGTPARIIKQSLSFELLELTTYYDVDSSDIEIFVYEDLTEIPIPTAGFIKINDEVIEYDYIDTAAFPHIIYPALIGGRGAKGTVAANHDTGSKITEYGAGTTSLTHATLDENFSTGALTVYVDDLSLSGTASEFRDLLEKRLRGDTTVRFAGDRGAGITLSVDQITRQLILCEIALQIADGYDKTVVHTNVSTAFFNHFNRLPVEQDAYAYALACAIQDVEGVEGIDKLIINSVTFDGTTSADVAVGANERASGLSIAIT